MDLSAGSLIVMLVVSTIGFSLFLYGKKQARVPQLTVGVLLMVFPYFVTDALLSSLIGAALVFGMWLGVRAGW